MATITTASQQWSSRPDDERFDSLHALHAHTTEIRNQSRSKVVPTKSLTFAPAAGDAKGLTVSGESKIPFNVSHWAFQQLATLAKAPAGYLRSLPGALVADCLNYGVQFERDVEDIQLLLQSNGTKTVRAATGPNYGRVWNSEITQELVERFGDGVSGEWRVPGEFGKAVKVTKDNTTLYASDRDMFVFLANEKNKTQITNPRGMDAPQGPPAKRTLSRGFFIRNSETGNGVIGIAMFLFDYVCCNRIIWGAEQFKEIRIRHTSGAPDRWFNEIVPMIHAYANASEKPIEAAFAAAQAKRLDDRKNSLVAFLRNRNYPASMAPKLEAVHKLEEGRPIETYYDVVNAMTAYAKGVPFQDERVALETDAGRILELVAA